MNLDKNIHRALILTGPVGGTLMFLGLYIMGFIPPPKPSMSGPELVQFYESNSFGMRLGAYISFMGIALMTGFCAILSVLMKRVEGRFSPLAYLNLMVSAVSYPVGWVVLILPAAIAYRVGHSPDLVLFINDYFWLCFIAIPQTIVVQMCAVATCAFRDSRNNALGTVFPRWYGWYSLWECLTTIGVGVAFFNYTGVFTWAGAATFWMYILLYGTWIVVTTVVLLQSVNRQTDWDTLETIAPQSKADAPILKSAAS